MKNENVNVCINIDVGRKNISENMRQRETEQARIQEDAEDEEEDEDVFNPYLFIACLPNHSSVRIKNKIVIPPIIPSSNNPNITLVLDLEVIVFSY